MFRMVLCVGGLGERSRDLSELISLGLGVFSEENGEVQGYSILGSTI